MKKIFSLAARLFSTAFLISGFYSPASSQQFQKTYGGTQDDRAYSVIQTADGGYCVAGNTGSSTSTQYLHVVKFDNSMNVQWTFRINASSPNQTGRSIIQTADGGFVIAGNNNGIGASAGTRDYYILKINSAGSLVWTRVLDQNGAGGNNSLYSIKELANNAGFICAGTTDASCGTANIALIKLNSDGTYSWKSNLGACNGSGDSWSARVEIANDGGFVVCGTSNSGSNGGGDLYLIKTTSSGSVSWGKRVGGSSYIDQGYALTKSNDGGYAVAGYTKSYPTAHAGVGKNVYVVKFDSGGGLQWTRTVGGTSSSGSGDNIANSIIQTSGDNGYLVAGSTSFYGSGGGIDAYVAKLTSSGTLSWTKTFGGSSTDEIQSVIQNTNGDFVLAGLTASYVNPGGQFDWYLLTLASDGSSTCAPNMSSGGNAGSGGTTGTDTNNPTTSINDRGSSGTVSTYTGVVTTVFSNPVPSISGSPIACQGGTTLTASGGNTYSWNTGATTTSIVVTPTVNTTYTVTATNSSGCTGTAIRLLRTVTTLGSGNTCSNNITVIDGEMWFKFVADSAHERIIANSQNINSLTIYSGSCNALNAIATASVNPGDTTIGIDVANLTIGNTYFAKAVSTTGSIIKICIELSATYTCPSTPTFSCDYIKNGGFESGPLSIGLGGINGAFAFCWSSDVITSCNIKLNGNTPDLFDKKITALMCTQTGAQCFQGAGACVGIPINFSSTNGAVNTNPPILPIFPNLGGDRYASLWESGGEGMSAELFTLTPGKYLLEFYTAPMNCNYGTQPTLCIELHQFGVAANNIPVTSTLQPDITNSAIGQWTPNTICVDLSNKTQAQLNSIDRIAIGMPAAGQRLAFDDFRMQKMADAGPDHTLTYSCECVTLGSTCPPFPQAIYSWSPATGLSDPTAANPTACPANTTVYTLTVSDPNSICTDIDQVTVTVPAFTPTVANFTFSKNEDCMGSNFTFTNTSTGAASYSWNFGDPLSGTSNTSAQTNPSHQYNTPGQFVVTLTATSGPSGLGCCSVFSALVSVTPSTSSPAYNASCCSESSSIVYSFNSSNNSYNFDLTGTATNPAPFNAAAIIKGIVTIKSGASITLQNITAEFGPWGKIIVEPGATLTLLGATLTGLSACNTMWQGIEVWGNPSLTQDPSQSPFPQGKLVVSTYTPTLTRTIIERAHNAITAGKFPDPFLPNQCPINTPNSICLRGEYDICYSGGVLDIQSSILGGRPLFRENAHNIRVAPYTYPNTSSVLRCDFRGTVLADPGYLMSFTSYKYPDGANRNYAYANPLGRTYRFGYVLRAGWPKTSYNPNPQTFVGNNFNPSAFSLSDKGAELGIEILDGKCVIDDNTFLNCIRGISGMYTTTSFNGNSITNNTFYNPIQQFVNTVSPTPVAGIYLRAAKGDRIAANTFGNAGDANSQIYNPYGIYLNSSGSFRIVDNQFLRLGTGVWINNSAKYGGRIQRYVGQNGNFFRRNKIGIFTLNNNVKLRIKCNTANNDDPSLYTFNWSNFKGSKLSNQGLVAPLSTDITKPAGNRFDINNSPPINTQLFTKDIYTYYSHSGPSEYIPTNAVNSVVKIQLQVPTCTTFVNCCPVDSSLGPIAPPPSESAQRVQEIDDLLTDLQGEYDSTYNILDNGNTNQLLSALDVDTSDIYIQNLLLNNSPLSDQVMQALINWADYASASYFSEIIIPNSPVADSLQELLNNKLEDLPAPVADAIRNAQSSNTYRTLTNISREFSTYATERINVFNDILTYYADTGFTDSLITVLKNENTMETDQALVGLYLNIDSISAAQEQLASMSASNAEEEAFISLYGMLADLSLDSLSIYNMDSTQEALVRSIANMPPSLAQANACAILHAVFNENCSEPDTSSARMQSPVFHFEMKQPRDLVYLGNNIPNPFNNTTVIPYQLPDGIERAFICIYNITGTMLSKYEISNRHNTLTVSATSLENGVYFYRMEANGQILGSRKMIIIK